METIKKIELWKFKRNDGSYKYDAVENGIVIASRISRREYVAAICSTQHKKIINGIGRDDLIPNALSKIAITDDMRLAVISNDSP